MSPWIRQRGMTFIGLLIILAIVAFFAIVIIKVGPLYLENFKVVSSMKSLKDEEDIDQRTPREIKQILLKRLDINDVTSVTGKDITIDQTKERTVVRVAYEARAPLFGNLAAVAAFPDNEIELGGP